ncbi:DUF4416 domain-containing protein [Deltaproteobacteria bacterium Smac51]|nr:DUF4416 domain-containing protein [Deltaproteobacteria bacterium Smac51]
METGRRGTRRDYAPFCDSIVSTLKPLPLVKPFAAIFSWDRALIVQALVGLSDLLGGEPDILSPEFPVIETKYYEREMGGGLFKTYASWPDLITPDRLVAIKLASMKLETRHSNEDRRMVNIDPGYVFSGGLVLSTGKFRGHRLHLGHGIWGELTLHFHQGEFQAFPWTYQDYKTPEIQTWLIKMRKACMVRLRETGGEG